MEGGERPRNAQPSSLDSCVRTSVLLAGVLFLAYQADPDRLAAAGPLGWTRLGGLLAGSPRLRASRQPPSVRSRSHLLLRTLLKS